MDDLDREPHYENRPFLSRRRRRRRARSRRPQVLAGVVILLVMVGLGSWLWLRSGGTGTEPEGEHAAIVDSTRSSPASSTNPTSVTTPDTLDLPDLEASDVFLREVVESASAHPEWAAWLVGEDLARRFVAAVVRVSRGASPAPSLTSLEPEGEFRVRESEGGTIIDAVSYRRYDILVETFTSLDYVRVARLYEQLHPLFEDAHRELGFPDGTFDSTVARAVENVIAVQVPDGPLEVVAESGAYKFRDPALESRTPLAKHLLRMGPRNARRVQAKVRVLAAALELLASRPLRDPPGHAVDP